MPNTFGSTFGGSGGDTFGTTFGSHDALAIADMVTITTKQVYTDLVDATGITSDAEAVTAAEALTVNPEVEAYDWSCQSVFTLNDGSYTQSIPLTMVSDTHAIGGGHNYPNDAGEKCWFLSQAGGAYVAVVEAITELTYSGCHLVRFTANPSATLYRCPIITDASLQNYVAAGGKFWQFYQDQSIKLRECVSLTQMMSPPERLNRLLEVVEHDDSDWEQGDVTTGSGRPALVPLNDGTLVLIGTAEFGGSGQPQGNCRLSLDIAEIVTELAGHGETITTMDLPGVSGASDLGLVRSINGGVVRPIVYGIS